jgi:hypothetical protein
VVEEPPTEVPGPVSGEADDKGTVDATEAEESVAMRLAFVADRTDLDAAWLQEAEAIEAEAIEAETAPVDESAAIRVEAETAPVDDSAAIRVEAEAAAAEREAAELEAAWARDAEARWILHVAAANSVVEADESVEPQADEPATAEPAPVGSIDEGPQVDELRADELEAAEAEAARLAPKELLEAQADEPGDLVEREALPRRSFEEGVEELSEKEAETQALREALAIVLGNESQAGSVEPWSASDAAPSSATPAAPPAGTSGERSDESAAQGELAGPAEAAAPDQRTPEAEPEPAPRRRNGLFRRFGGS